MAELTSPTYTRLNRFWILFAKASLAVKESSEDSVWKNFPQFSNSLRLLQTSNEKISAPYSKLLPRYPEESLTEIHYGRNQKFWNFSEHQRQVFKLEKEPTGKVFKTKFYQSRTNLLRLFLKYLRFSASIRTLGKNFRTLLKNFSCAVTFSFIESGNFFERKKQES